jgi:hypothetical protein
MNVIFIFCQPFHSVFIYFYSFTSSLFNDVSITTTSMGDRMINECGAFYGMRLAGETEVFEDKKPAQAPFC